MGPSWTHTISIFPPLFKFNESFSSKSWQCAVATKLRKSLSRPTSRVLRTAKQTWRIQHYDDVIMTMLASQITSLMVVYSIVYLGVNQRKHQSSASLAFVREIHRGPVNFPHKRPVTRKMFPFDDVIMIYRVNRVNYFWHLYRNPCSAEYFADSLGV